YTSLQSGQEAAKSPEPEFTDLDLGMVIREVTAQFETLCQAEGYLLETDIRPGLLVRGSRQQLSRVLYNLIDNGLSHSGENRKVCITASERKSVVRVEVRDFGEGIPRNDLPYIWERYFTLKQRKRNAKGSGLGLAISREILLAHGAGFGVESEEGEGSVFWFELEKRSPEETGMKQENQPHA
ncbi:MAG: HAMP domain-containing sensor histidine kinase, partial [Candidatus Limivivens sp.]|nr:HAMP domain-containing sensor histidine kinase [Candidatus Limivivens sp.]